MSLPVLEQLAATLARDEPLVYCRLVETRGSTPQKAGATMLVYPNGRQAGTLGGGCVEAEVKRVALAACGQDAARIEVFQLDHDYGWDDGLICGGRMSILVQPIAGGSQLGDYYRQLAASHAQGGGTEIIVIDDRPTGLPVGSSWLFDAAGQLVSGTMTGMPIDPALVAQLRPLAQRPLAYQSLGAAFLPVLPHVPLVLIGGGHIAQAVAALADQLEFEVSVVDDRAEFVSQERFPMARHRWSGPFDELLQTLPLPPAGYCIIVTRGHAHDQRALHHLVQRDLAYLGMIGSRRKIKMIFENLMDEGIAAESLQTVFAPLGIDIGSQTVPEIAVSICAELVAHRNRGGIVPGRPRSVLDQPPDRSAPDRGGA